MKDVSRSTILEYLKNVIHVISHSPVMNGPKKLYHQGKIDAFKELQEKIVNRRFDVIDENLPKY
ncbi:MAG: hypothetical protein A2173_03820 [Planctomycetes bacterium RBG_13_44_8b]|nr:MAG: hypothetical protein A2173_03820 [Planctomycetes bacterium RBG_13_44_8b]